MERGAGRGDAGRVDVLVDVRRRAASRDRDDRWVLVEQPGEGELAGGDGEALGEATHGGVPAVVDREVVTLEAGCVAPEVPVADVGDGSGEEAPAERAPGDDPHPELVRGG